MVAGMANSKEKSSAAKVTKQNRVHSFLVRITVACFSIPGIFSSIACDEKTNIPGQKQTTTFSTSLKPVVETENGSLSGRVSWAGPIPTVEGFSGPISPLSEHASKPRLAWPNPNAPKINSDNKGIENAVVYLDAREHFTSSNANFPPVEVETNHFKMQVNQGGVSSPVGFILLGEGVDFVNKQDFFFTIRARGDAFFSIPLSNKNKPVRKVFTKPGLVTLTTGSGQFWMRSHLFVLNSPHAARCDKDGRFEINDIPTGKHDFKVWIPSWKVMEKEIDAETWEITRLEFTPSPTKKFSTFIKPGSNSSDQITSFELSDLQSQK